MSTINVFKFNSIFIIILIWTSSICDCGEHYISGNGMNIMNPKTKIEFKFSFKIRLLHW